MGTHFFWDPVEDNVIQERDDTGAVTADYTTEPYHYGNLISHRRDGASRFYCFDGQGSTRALTDQSGNVTNTYAYTTFGELTEHTGSAENPFQYMGQREYYRNEVTADYLVRRRPIVVTFGRWCSVDPLGPLYTLNMYAYAENNPLRYIDPSGLLKQEILPADGMPNPLGDFFDENPFSGPCAKYGVVTKWVLEDTDNPRPGFIIQFVQFFKMEVHPCEGKQVSQCAPPSSFPPRSGAECRKFLEIWRVQGDTIAIGGTLDDPKPLTKNDGIDVFLNFGTANRTRGDIEQIGIAIYLSDDQLKAIKLDSRTGLDFVKELFTSGNKAAPSGLLLSTCVEPNSNAAIFWTNFSNKAKAKSTKTVEHSWNCCKGTRSLKMTLKIDGTTTEVGPTISRATGASDEKGRALMDVVVDCC